MSQEDITMRLLVDGSQATKSLQQTRAAATGLGGGLTSVVGGLDKIGGKAGADAEKAVRSLSFAMGAAGGRGSELLGVVGDIAGALTGGPLVIGLVAVGAGIAGLATQAAAAGRALTEFGESINAAGRANLAAYRRDLNDVTRALEEFGRQPREIAVSNAKFALEQAQTSQLFYEEEAKRQRERLRAVEREREQRRSSDLDVLKRQQTTIAEATKLRDINTERARTARAEVAAAQDLLDKTQSLALRQEGAELRAARERRESAAASGAARPTGHRRSALLDPFARIDAENQKRDEALSAGSERLAEAQYQADLARFKRTEADEAEHAKRLFDIKKAWLDEERSIKLALDSAAIADREAQLERERVFAQESAAIATQAMGIGVSATQGLVDALITGQEHALEHFAIGVSRQAGSALIGHGINLGGAAVVSGLTGNLPLAGVQAAGAAGLIGTGITLGGIATGAEHLLAGGRIGSPLSDKSIRDPGVNRSSRSNGAAEAIGTFQIVVNYGVAGPAPEDTARAVAKANHTAARRGIA